MLTTTNTRKQPLKGQQVKSVNKNSKSSPGMQRCLEEERLSKSYLGMDGRYHNKGRSVRIRREEKARKCGPIELWLVYKPGDEALKRSPRINHKGISLLNREICFPNKKF